MKKYLYSLLQFSEFQYICQSIDSLFNYDLVDEALDGIQNETEIVTEQGAIPLSEVVKVST